MAIIENDYAAYIQTPNGEVPLRDLSAPQTAIEKAIEICYTDGVFKVDYGLGRMKRKR